MASRPLNAKQQRFVDEYLIDLNATQAAIRAGYSAKTASQGAAQLLANIKVRAAVDAAIAKRSGNLEITAEKVLRDLEASRLAAAKDGQHSAAIRASELQGKHVGMFVDRSETVITERMVVRAPDRPADAQDWASKHGPH
jgi:phage terminase small subunit